MPENFPYHEAKEIILKHHEEVADLKAKEKTSGWAYYDSPLEDDSRDSHSYGNEFSYVTPKEVDGKPIKTVREYIETFLEEKKGEALAVEFGGSADKLFQQFTPGFFAKTAGIVLNDLHPPEGRVANHIVVEGDIYSKETKNKIADWFGHRPVDLIFEKLDGGRIYLPDLRMSYSLFAWWYKILAENGVIFAQTPIQLYLHEHNNDEENANLFGRWISMIKKDYEGLIDIQVSARAIRLNKLPGAPESLPQFAE